MKIHDIAVSLRKYRQWHRWIGISIGILIVISSLSGILLALKKNVDTLQPPTRESKTSSGKWLDIKTIGEQASQALIHQSGLPQVTIDRMDVRPDKGIVKVNFVEGYWEVQLDGYSGEVLSIARRHSDWIEKLHDGSIISDTFKLISMHALGLGLLLLSISGFWLWFGPRKMRKIKKKQRA